MQRKEKISITVSKEILKLVDKYGKSENINSRSEIIEHLLTNAVSEMVVDTAVIVWHNQHIVNGKPSIFLKFGKATHIERLVRKLTSEGIENIIIAIPNLAEQIRKVLELHLRFL